MRSLLPVRVTDLGGLVIALGALIAIPTYSQSPPPGTASTSVPIPGSGHDYIHGLSETVDPASGSLSLRINVPIPPGRGLSLPFYFAYDTSGLFALSQGETPAWDHFGTGYNKGGWSYTIPAAAADIGYLRYQVTHGIVTCTYYTNWRFVDATGARYGLGLFSSPQRGGTEPCQLTETLSGGDLKLLASVPSGASSATFLKVVDSDGTTYSFTSSVSPGTGIASRVEDRNGNVVQFQDSGGGVFTETDTAGRTLLSSSGFGATGNTLTVSGLASPYQLTWESGTYNVDPQAILLVNNAGTYSCPGFGSSGSWSGVQTITIPNGQQYNFQYDPTYGLPTQITYPSGAWVKYTWQVNSASLRMWSVDSNGDPSTCLWQLGRPAVASRTVSFDGVTAALKQTFQYSTTWPDNTTSSWTAKQTTVTTYDLAGGTSFTTTYTYGPKPSGEPLPRYIGGYPKTQDTNVPVEQTVTYGDVNGSTIKSVTKSWNDAQQLALEQTSLNGGSNSQTTYTYGPGNQITEVDEYDFGQAVPSRKTSTTYQGFPATPLYPSALSILDRPSAVITLDGNGNKIAETDYSYDQGTITSATTPSGTHDETNYGPGSTAPRGNVTKVTRKCLQSCADSTTTLSYDETGQVLTRTDPCGNTNCSDMTGTNHTTTYSYADTFDSNPSSNTNAYLTQVTDPLGHTSSFKYAYSDGQLISATDQNGKITSYLYSDSLRRLTETDYPEGGKTTISYNDAAPSPSVTTTRLITTTPSTLNLSTTAVMDGMGQVTQTQLTTDPDGTDFTDTTLDGVGRV